MDIYVANDTKENLLWINQRDGTFKNVGLLSDAALGAGGKPEASMGVDAGDFDNDGDEDLIVTVLPAEGSHLYVNDGTGQFDDMSAPSQLGPLSLGYSGFGTAWFDCDRQHPDREREASHRGYEEANHHRRARGMAVGRPGERVRVRARIDASCCRRTDHPHSTGRPGPAPRLVTGRFADGARRAGPGAGAGRVVDGGDQASGHRRFRPRVGLWGDGEAVDGRRTGGGRPVLLPECAESGAYGSTVALLPRPSVQD